MDFHVNFLFDNSNLSIINTLFNFYLVAYSQAPASMKSVLQASWLMTVAVGKIETLIIPFFSIIKFLFLGNLIVLVIAESKIVDNQVWEYVMFAGLLLVATLSFITMVIYYKYVEDEITKKEIVEVDKKNFN